MFNTVLSKGISFLRKLLIPSYCFYCREYGDGDWCTRCAALIKPILSTRIVLSATMVSEVHAVAAYEDPLKSLIIAKNWSDYTASVLLGRLIWNFSVIRHIPFDGIVPVPLHRSRFAYRGYNPVDVMAQEIARLSGKPLYPALIRVKKTALQVGLPAYKRYANLEGAFRYNEDAIGLEGKTIVLLDDVMTSGATLQAAGKALLKGYPSKIYSFVVCRAL